MRTAGAPLAPLASASSNSAPMRPQQLRIVALDEAGRVEPDAAPQVQQHAVVGDVAAAAEVGVEERVVHGFARGGVDARRRLRDAVRRNAPRRRPFVARPRHETRLGLFRRRALPGLCVLAKLREITPALRRLGPQQEGAPLDLDVVVLFLQLAQPDRRDQAPGSEKVAVDDEAGHDSTVPPNGPGVQAGLQSVAVVSGAASVAMEAASPSRRCDDSEVDQALRRRDHGVLARARGPVQNSLRLFAGGIAVCAFRGSGSLHHFAAVTMISTRRPGRQSRGDCRQARTGGCSGRPTRSRRRCDPRSRPCR